MSEWQHEVDLLVVGSGAAALSAGIRGHDLGLEVLLVEKSAHVGGSTAMSGGVCWVPANPHMLQQGIEDSRADALTYLQHITEGEVERERLEAYVDGSQRMLAYMEAHTELRFEALEKYTDYYPEAPGGRSGGRSMEPEPFDGSKLGPNLKDVRLPHPQSQILGRFGITARLAQTLLVNNLKMKLLMLWLFIKYAFRWRKRKKAGRDTYLCAGNALVSRLYYSILQRKVPVWLGSGASELITDPKDGRVLGAVVEREGQPVRVRARRGVLLAAGGFEKNEAMREQYQRTPITTEWTAANPHNVGDGIKMGLAAGGTLDLMKEAWWTPTTLVPGSDLAWVLVVEKSLPGGIFVNQKGRRFTNEAAPYVDVVVAMYEDDESNGGDTTIPAWLVFDADFRKKYPVGPVPPGYAVPDKRLRRRYRKNYLRIASSVAELAAKIEVDPAELTATVGRFNAQALAGKDDDFGRGESASDRYYGDYRVTPNPCLAPLKKAPFYAIPIYPGDLGTKGGLVTDVKARVLDGSGVPIPGLFAAGNTSASVMGRTYPGAGGTIGPALTFGFVAAETAHENALQATSEAA